MLKIVDLHVSVDNKPILKGLNLTINPGEVHAIMGPNGSGKSTLAHTLAGKSGYNVTQGSALFKDINILDLEPEIRAQMGLFLAFQYPVAIPGVSNINFLKAALNSILKAKNQPELDAYEFLARVKGELKTLNMTEEMLSRAVNDGFSGGEKKRNEVLQMAILEPSLAILDETDSGLDIDSMKIVGAGVNRLRNKDRSFLIVTHYQRLLDHIEPDKVHVLADGKIIKSGDKTLALELEEMGYGWVTDTANTSEN